MSTAKEGMARPTPGPGHVVLDIGDGVGALVLHTPAELDGQEIEISPAGVARRSHSRVRPRHIGPRVLYAAVYPGLAAGDYTLWRDASTPAGTVTITGGQITARHWPAA